MKRNTTNGLIGLLAAAALGLSPAMAAQQQKPAAAPLSEAGSKLEAKYAATLDALQKDIAQALPKIDEPQQAAFLQAYQAEAAAQAPAKAVLNCWKGFWQVTNWTRNW